MASFVSRRGSASRWAPVPRWVLRVSAVGAACTAAVLAAGPTAAAPAAPAPRHARTTGHVHTTAREQAASVPLDGFTIGYLPDGVGSASDFRYEWQGVVFHTRDWESRSGDGYRVDLTVQTLRGTRLTDLAALRGYLTGYEEKDPDRWRLAPFRNGPYHGFVSTDQAFWLVRPGVAASVGIDRGRYCHADLLRTAHGFQPA